MRRGRQQRRGEGGTRGEERGEKRGEGDSRGEEREVPGVGRGSTRGEERGTRGEVREVPEER